MNAMNMNHINATRRNALTSIAALSASLALPNVAAAKGTAGKAVAAPQEMKPYETLNPPVKGETTRVRLLFSYDCPFCRSYHNGLVQWGATLPKPLSFIASPLITSDNTKLMSAVLGRLIGEEVAPQALHSYDYMMYAKLQGDPDQGTPPVEALSMTDVLRTLVQAGADGHAIQAFLKGRGKGIEKRIPTQAALIKTFNLTSTPSVAITGRYVVTPDNAQGDPSQFLLLLNGIVSRVIQGDARAS